MKPPKYIRAPRPKSLQAIFDKTTQKSSLGRLWRSLKQQHEQETLLIWLLPNEVASFCTHAVIKGTTLCLYTNQPGLSTRLHYQSRTILNHIQQQPLFKDIQQVKFRYQSSRILTQHHLEARQTHSTKTLLSESNLAFLKTWAETTPIPQLRKSLLRLQQHQQQANER